MPTLRPRTTYNAERIVDDMARRGWNNSDLARAANLSNMTITRFLRREAQTAKTAERISRALGHSIRRYIILAEQIEAVLRDPGACV